MGNQRAKAIWFVSIAVVVIFLCTGMLLIKIFISDDGSKRIRMIQTVQLLKPPPPPPPKIEEKPPEPEIEKKEIKEPEETPEEVAEDNVPADSDLGLDAEGTAGSDAFGLVGKKGGRALIGGGNNPLLLKYAWYFGILQKELCKKVQELIDKNGGIPKGKLQTCIKIMLDEQGAIVKYSIIGSSGNHKMDDAVEEVLRFSRISEPPPAGMPRSMKVRITSQG